MLSFKLPMKKYLTLIYITLSVMTFAQFQDNVFEKDKTAPQQSELSHSAQVESNGSAEEGNPSSFGNGIQIREIRKKVQVTRESLFLSMDMFHCLSLVD